MPPSPSTPPLLLPLPLVPLLLPLLLPPLLLLLPPAPLLLPFVIPPLLLPLDCAPESVLAKGETSLLPHAVEAATSASTAIVPTGDGLETTPIAASDFANFALARSMSMTKALSQLDQIFSDTLIATRSMEARVTP
jgi:hypothetical protein